VERAVLVKEAAASLPAETAEAECRVEYCQAGAALAGSAAARGGPSLPAAPHPVSVLRASAIRASVLQAARAGLVEHLTPGQNPAQLRLRRPAILRARSARAQRSSVQGCRSKR